MINFDKYIIASGPSEEVFLNAVQEMANMYADTPYVHDIKAFKAINGDNKFIINFHTAPDFERFKYFVNYLNYPEIESYSAKVMGFCTVKDEDKIPKDKNGKRVLLYVSDKDEEGDNVFAIFEKDERTHKFGFALGEEYTELNYKEFDFSEPKIETSDFTLSKVISPDQSIQKNKKTGSGCVLALTILIIGIVSLQLFL